MKIDEKIYLSLVYLYQYSRLLYLKKKSNSELSFWPSELSADIFSDGIIKTIGKCGRAIYYSKLGLVGSPPSAMSIRKMKIGKMIELDLIQDIKNAGYKNVLSDIPVKFDFVETNVTDGKPIKISGKIDMIVEDNDMYDIYEIKSAYGYKFENDVQKKGIFNEGYAMQIGTYMYGIRAFNVLSDIGINSNKVRTGILKYISRGNCEHADDIYIDINDDVIVAKSKGKTTNVVNISAIFAKLARIYTSIENRELPERNFLPDLRDIIINDLIQKHRLSKKDAVTKDPKILSWQCSYCSYRNECIEDYNPTETENIADIDSKINKIEVLYKENFGIPISDIITDHAITIDDEV